MAPSSSKKSSKSGHAATKEPSEDMLDRFHDPDKKVCTIIATNTTKKTDLFFDYRPKTSKEFLTYNISQTCAKMDCGPTRIHLQQTHAEYEKFPPGYVFVEPEPSPPKKRKHAQHGRGPVWLYLDEIYKKKAEIKQAIHHRAMEIRQKRKAKVKKIETREQKEKIVTRGGPKWFQELSPQQLSAVDELPNSLEMDIKNGTIFHLQDNLAQLGLVLRPNHNHVKFCVDRCCHNPVEFLLMLYQLINPKGKPYTLNDRLLLSAVVHLSMTTVLRELHIRIPSPPPERRTTYCALAEPKRTKPFKSPYLEPFTFEPDPPKHEGIYKNQHIQYPESRYFAYVEDLKSEIGYNSLDESEEDECSIHYENNYDFNLHEEIYSNYSGVTTNGPTDKVLDDERIAAQLKYNQLTKRKNVPRLLRPSIYTPCPQELTSSISIQQRVENYDQYLSRSIIRGGEEEGILKESDMMVCPDCEPGNTEDNTPVTTIAENKNYARQPQDGQYSDSAESISSTVDQTDSLPDATPPKLPETNSTMISGGITIDRDGNPVPIIFGIVSPKALVCKCNVDPLDAGPLANPDAPPKSKKYVCRCRQRIEKEEQKKRELAERKRLQREMCTCEQCICANRISSSSSELSSLGSFVPPSDDIYLKDTTEKLLEVKEPPPFHCHCKDIVEKQMETIKGHMECQEKCKVKKRKPTYIIADTKIEEGEDGETKVKIISGVKAPKTCTCMEKYYKQVEKFEREKRNEQAQEALRSTERSFHISGVKPGPDGKPIYMLSGLAQDRFCPKCEELKAAEESEKNRLATMPPFPKGRQKYVISGVRDTPAGKAYIISGAIPIDDCDCMKLYDTFMRQHSRCFQLYERYMQKIQSDTEEYMSDLPAVQECIEPVEPEETEHSIDDVMPESSHSASPVDDDSPVESGGSVQIHCVCARDGQGDQYNWTVQGEEEGEGQGPDVGNGNEAVDEIKQIGPDNTQQISVNNKTSENMMTGPADNKPTRDKPNKDDQSPFDGKRFILLKKLPCNASRQIAIVKKALKVLAEDGFPMAKLPDVHKLPHFKLWMDLRCGRHYTQEDRVEFAKASKEFWQHLQQYKKRGVNMTLDISPEEAKQYSWAEAKAVKKLTDDYKEAFCRAIKQNVINSGREFFPSMYDYELPTKSFRDCYFAYTPSKEEAAFACRPWNAFEYIDYKLIRSHKN